MPIPLLAMMAAKVGAKVAAKGAAKGAAKVAAKGAAKAGENVAAKGAQQGAKSGFKSLAKKGMQKLGNYEKGKLGDMGKGGESEDHKDTPGLESNPWPSPVAAPKILHKGGRVRKTGFARVKKGEVVLTKPQQRKVGKKIMATKAVKGKKSKGKHVSRKRG